MKGRPIRIKFGVLVGGNGGNWEMGSENIDIRLAS